MINEKEIENSFELALVNALKIPSVKVNRREFLIKTFDNYAKDNGIDILQILDRGPVEAGISISALDKVAASLVEKRTLQSTGASFAAGLPGGLAMAASIPADTLQFFGVALRLSQELAYIYGYKDMSINGDVNSEEVKENLTLFLGVMFGVGGASSTLKVVSASISKQVLKKLPQKALTKTIYYPIIKKIAAAIGVKITKQTFSKSVSKIIPVLGGVISGGLTYLSMKPMGNRLKDTLSASINYTEEEFNRDLKEMSNVIDMEFTELEDNEEKSNDNSAKNEAAFSVADELLKFKQLLDMGVITEEEFSMKKQELLYGKA